jgi:beta-N-acetylglucosaminidase
MELYSHQLRLAVKKLHSLTLQALLILAVFAGSSCHRAGKQESPLPAWSSNNVLAIPYFIREQKIMKGNLVRNGSFETGKWMSVDSLRKSYSIDGWQQTGNNVLWMDQVSDSALTYDNFYTGKHAVKIVRIAADEMVENGDGITSAFIRVVPGNYSFSFYTRLKDIRPYNVRLGTRMHDAIDVKILFYDKNKILIDSKYRMPFKGQKIDNSFKSLSFANFNYIKEFAWSRVIGKSHSFPFSEGDIPDNARYVRLFIGLKGTGTMWIDDVDFHYTRANFTPLERFSLIMDSTLTKQDLIIPAPRKVSKLGSVVLYKPGQKAESLPKIIMPRRPDKSTEQAASLLLEKVRQVMKEAGAGEDLLSRMKVQYAVSQDEVNRSLLVFSVGKTLLYEKYKEFLPVNSIAGKDQGYFVFTSNDLPNVIFLAGNNETGDFYGAATVLQLFDHRIPVFYNARIIDFPDTYQRFYNIRAWKDQKELNYHRNTIRDLMLFKLNGAYIYLNPDSLAPFYLNSLVSFGSQWENPGLFRFFQWIVPDSAPGVAAISFNASGNDPLASQTTTRDRLLKKIIEEGNNAHAAGLSVAPSFIFPHDSTLEYNPAEVLELTDTYKKESRFMLSLQKYMRDFYPGQHLEYCLPWYNNELIDYSLGYADVFMAALMEDMDKGVSFLWSGSSFYTVRTDAADIFRYNNLLNRSPVLLDNSLLTSSKGACFNGSAPYYPHKLRLYNFFEPYSNDELRYYKDRINTNRVFINQSVQSELEKIKVLTALDFYWNMEDYDPDFSLWKILVSLYGQEVAKELMDFGDAFAALLEINLLLQQNNQVKKNYTSGTETLASLKELLDHIAEGLGKNHPLVGELKSLYDDGQNTFKKLSPVPLP